MDDPNQKSNRDFLMSQEPLFVLQSLVNELHHRKNLVAGLKVYIDLKMYDEAKDRVDWWMTYLENLLEQVEEYIDQKK